MSLCTTFGWSNHFPFAAIFFSADYLIVLFLFIVIYCQLCFPCSETVMYDIKACFPLPSGLCLSTVFTHCCCFNNRFLLSDLEDVWLKKNPAAKTHSEMQSFCWKSQTCYLCFTSRGWWRCGKGYICYLIPLFAQSKVIWTSKSSPFWESVSSNPRIFYVSRCPLISNQALFDLFPLAIWIFVSAACSSPFLSVGIAVMGWKSG